MTIPLDTKSYDYKIYKTLNEDVELISNQYGRYDLNMRDKDYVNVTGLNSLQNACVIAILTRYNELKTPLYEGFGCRVHELIKGNKTRLQDFKIETYLTETLDHMRRVKNVNWINVTEKTNNSYEVSFSITSLNDELVTGKVSL